MAKSGKRRVLRWGVIGVGVLLGLAVVAALAVAGYGAWVLEASRPRVSGQVALAGLAAPVSITRDAEGVPSVTATSESDMARAIGFLHGQERFFQMDLQRRASAGELSGLVGAVALPLDRAHRLHRFRAHAERVLALQTPRVRALLSAYTAGVNAGLAALGHTPFEYTLLRAAPQPWRDEDALLTVYTMYFELQAADGSHQALHGALTARLGPQMAAFLDPDHTPLDAPADGSASPAPAIPDHAPDAGTESCTPAVPPAPERGSNSFAVAGRLSSSGAALVANDMHLGLDVPNIWYRARQVLRDPQGEVLISNGVTLPGLPIQVVGSNGHIAWGFTDSYAETGDLVRLDMLPPEHPGAPARYATPDGPRPIETVHERLCPLRGACEDMPIEETIWGPVQGHDRDGAPLVWRWAAEDDNAIAIDGLLQMEHAQSVRAALDAAHLSAMPQQNLLVGDSDGHIGWTVIGHIPRRVGLDDQLPHSWADGTHRWNGWLDPSQFPEIVDPPSGRLWTANGRVVGGAALTALGDGGYADGLRAGRIRDDLAARDRFAPVDFLAIQTDDHAVVLRPWQALLLAAIDREPAHLRNGDAALRAEIAGWGEHAVPGSIGYRLVHEYRAAAIASVFGGWVRAACVPGPTRREIPSRSGWAVETLLQTRPPALVPPGFADWNAVDAALLTGLRRKVADAGGLADFTWGAVNHVGIHHPLARALPVLGWLTDPADLPEAGDAVVPRVQVTGFGASERLAVSPGHEADALLEMPVGQSGNPIAGYGDAGHVAWREGTSHPLLPGPTRWTLGLVPAP